MAETLHGAPTEIERKYLLAVPLKDIPGIDQATSIEIAQGYLVRSADGVMRLRKKGDRLLITFKGAGSLARTEIECPIDFGLFNAFWPATEGKRVEKTRYTMPLEGVLGLFVEIDEFHGDNEGHYLVEVEFPTMDAAEAFIPPNWFGEEVTEDPRYGNSQIAEHGFPTK